MIIIKTGSFHNWNFLILKCFHGIPKVYIFDIHLHSPTNNRDIPTSHKPLNYGTISVKSHWYLYSCGHEWLPYCWLSPFLWLLFPMSKLFYHWDIFWYKKWQCARCSYLIPYQSSVHCLSFPWVWYWPPVCGRIFRRVAQKQYAVFVARLSQTVHLCGYVGMLWLWFYQAAYEAVNWWQ